MKVGKSVTPSLPLNLAEQSNKRLLQWSTVRPPTTSPFNVAQTNR